MDKALCVTYITRAKQCLCGLYGTALTILKRTSFNSLTSKLESPASTTADATGYSSLFPACPGHPPNLTLEALEVGDMCACAFDVEPLFALKSDKTIGGLPLAHDKNGAVADADTGNGALQVCGAVNGVLRTCGTTIGCAAIRP